MDVSAPDSVGSDMVLEHSQVTLMHGHELYYTPAAAYTQIHLSSQNLIYLFVYFHYSSKQSPCKVKQKNRIFVKF